MGIEGSAEKIVQRHFLGIERDQLIAQKLFAFRSLRKICANATQPLSNILAMRRCEPGGRSRREAV